MLEIQAARDVISRFEVKSPPVHVERIAKSLGITIQYGAFDDKLSGMAFIKDGVKVIGVNNAHHPNRQRFTIAHELGHMILHQQLLESSVHVDTGTLRRDFLATTGSDPIEIQANRFAAELLMPETFLREFLRDKSLDVEDEESLSELARRFKVSTMALQFRLLAFQEP
nr:ImmA/IrrE family metallo-endopeptidase [Asticcacaulis machinosus]